MAKKKKKKKKSLRLFGIYNSSSPPIKDKTDVSQEKEPRIVRGEETLDEERSRVRPLTIDEQSLRERNRCL